MSKQKTLIIGGTTILVIAAIGGVLFLMLGTPAIYDGEMELAGTITIGEYVPFSANKGDIIIVEITNFHSPTGHGFKIHLYGEGGISLWSRSDNKDVTYTIEITETQDYNLKFSVNSIISAGEVSFHLLVKKG